MSSPIDLRPVCTLRSLPCSVGGGTGRAVRGLPRPGVVERDSALLGPRAFRPSRRRPLPPQPQADVDHRHPDQPRDGGQVLPGRQVRGATDLEPQVTAGDPDLVDEPYGVVVDGSPQEPSESGAARAGDAVGADAEQGGWARRGSRSPPRPRARRCRGGPQRVPCRRPAAPTRGPRRGPVTGRAGPVRREHMARRPPPSAFGALRDVSPPGAGRGAAHRIVTGRPLCPRWRMAEVRHGSIPSRTTLPKQ